MTMSVSNSETYRKMKLRNIRGYCVYESISGSYRVYVDPFYHVKCSNSAELHKAIDYLEIVQSR